MFCSNREAPADFPVIRLFLVFLAFDGPEKPDPVRDLDIDREVCRRYLADEKDFSEENLERLGITKRYQNTDMEMCVEEILRDLDK